MRIFVTGGAGYVGAGVVTQLIGRGHDVVALVRTGRSGERLRGLGASVVEADLRQTGTWLPKAARCETWAHLAQERGTDQAALDRMVIEALVRLAVDSSEPRHLIYTSTLFGLGNAGAGILSEDSIPSPNDYTAARVGHERRVLEADGAGLTASVIRPGMVYGGGDGGTISAMIRSGFELGEVGVVGSGENRWSPVHLADVGTLYAAVAESQASGIFHAVDAEPLPVREIASIVAEGTGAGSVTHVPVAEAVATWGGFAEALTLDQPASAVRAHEIGWEPLHPSFRAAVPAALGEWRTSTAPGA